MKMKAALIAIVGAAALCLSVSAFGQNTVHYTGLGPGDGKSGTLYSSGYPGGVDVYTGIYEATVNGTPSTAIICDDFTHQINTGTPPWNATALQASTLNASNIGQAEFGSAIGLAGYAQVAYLVNGMFNHTDLDNLKGLTVTDIDEAIWDITTPGGISQSKTTHNVLTSNAQALVAWVKGLFSTDTAGKSYLNQYAQSLWILTPSPNNGPQELWLNGGSYNVPEGGAALLYLLLAGMACFGAMRFSSRSEFGNRTA
jgi:hypothetical protein